jgi:maleylacetoacetate isomerase
MNNVLYDYWRSSSSTRVRIALAIKQIHYQKVPISLIDGEQNQPDYLKINPQGLVPFWHDTDINLSQSLAIIEYLDDIYPTPTLLPNTPLKRARTRQYANLVSCDIHPLNNLRVKKYLNLNENEWLKWYHHWLNLGFEAYEGLLEQHHHHGPFTLNEELTIADLCLIPQIYNANRFGFNMDKFQKLQAIYNTCLEIKEFQDAMPADYAKI